MQSYQHRHFTLSQFFHQTSLKRRRTKASRTHKTETTHQGNGMNCSCNLYILKMREADRKTGNCTKEFIPKVVIKTRFKNAHYRHLERQYIHSRSQVCRLHWEWSLHTARGKMGSSKAASTLSWCIFSVKASPARSLLFTRTQEGTQA